MFEATLRNRSQPELGSLTVSFPIPEERYENVIFALKNLQIGDAGTQDCCIVAADCISLRSGFYALYEELPLTHFVAVSFKSTTQHEVRFRFF